MYFPVLSTLYPKQMPKKKKTLKNKKPPHQMPAFTITDNEVEILAQAAQEA